jgi:hypothetical protein
MFSAAISHQLSGFSPRSSPFVIRRVFDSDLGPKGLRWLIPDT